MLIYGEVDSVGKRMLNPISASENARFPSGGRMSKSLTSKLFINTYAAHFDLYRIF